MAWLAYQSRPSEVLRSIACWACSRQRSWSPSRASSPARALAQSHQIAACPSSSAMSTASETPAYAALNRPRRRGLSRNVGKEQQAREADDVAGGAYLGDRRLRLVQRPSVVGQPERGDQAGLAGCRGGDRLAVEQPAQNGLTFLSPSGLDEADPLSASAAEALADAVVRSTTLRNRSPSRTVTAGAPPGRLARNASRIADAAARRSEGSSNSAPSSSSSQASRADRATQAIRPRTTSAAPRTAGGGSSATARWARLSAWSRRPAARAAEEAAESVWARSASSTPKLCRAGEQRSSGDQGLSRCGVDQLPRGPVVGANRRDSARCRARRSPGGSTAAQRRWTLRRPASPIA